MYLLGHAAISKALAPYEIGVATGEHCQNRVMFKQFLQAEGMQFCQIDSCRMGGLNEILSVLFMAAKFGGKSGDKYSRCKLFSTSKKEVTRTAPVQDPSNERKMMNYV